MNTARKFLDNNELVGFFLAFFAAIAFSSKAIFVKISYTYGVDTITLLTIRMAFSLPFFLVILFMEEKKAKETLRGRKLLTIIGLGLLGYYLSSLFDFLGLMYISAGLERLILFLYPTMTVILSVFILKEKLEKRMIFALLLGYIGITLAIQHELNVVGENVLLGSLLVFAATLTFSVYLVGSGGIIPKVGSKRFTVYAMITSCLAVFIHFFATREISVLVQPSPVYIYGFVMAFFSTVIPSFFLAAAIQKIGASRTSIIGSIGPVSTIALAAIFLAEPISAIQIFGGACVIFGVLMLKKEKTKKQ
ncbi:MAG: EamA family transporter [Nitrospinae bacterium]|nr:EamA family transporter [Nitrospinota bacterium]